MTTKTEFKEATTNTQSAQQRMHYVSRVGVTPDEVTDIYKTWADSYDNVGHVTSRLQSPSTAKSCIYLSLSVHCLFIIFAFSKEFHCVLPLELIAMTVHVHRKSTSTLCLSHIVM